MSTTATEISKTHAKAVPGKYLTLTLGGESYGIDVLKIREIIRLQGITQVPQMPDFVSGVINLRGKIIPVVDLRIKFRLARTETTERTCIVVVQVQAAGNRKIQLGLVVDGVEEVLNISAGEIEETPDFGTALATDYILGMAKIKGGVKTLLDIDRVLATDALDQLAGEGVRKA